MKVEDFGGTVKDRDWRNTMRPSCPLTNITKEKGGKVTYDAKKKKRKKNQSSLKEYSNSAFGQVEWQWDYIIEKEPARKF